MNRSRHLVRALLIISALLLDTGQSQADARTDYLVEMLRSGSNYRVRVQAATALGQLRAQEALPHLVKALGDPNELVVITAATALGQLGDPSAIDALRSTIKRTKSTAVKSQVASTLRVLEALNTSSKGSRSSTRPWVLIRIDAMGNSSQVPRRDLPELLRRAVIEAVKNTAGVELQPEGLSSEAVRLRMKKENLQAYIISGSVLRLEKMSDKLYTKVSLNVFSNPEYNLLMMPSAEAAVGVSAASLTREGELANQDRAIRIVAEKLVSGIFETLRAMGSR